jgi:penicillin G amidase
MRKLVAILPLLLTTVLVYLLDKPHGPLPALGKLLDPINGFWANTEPTSKSFSFNLKLPVKEPVNVWLDERLVPHIHANNDKDIYVVQGYLHAYFRLWQMDLQTRAAGGRVSEILGDKALKFDREQRRKGMVYGAENSLKAMEADPRTKQMLDAYTTGINQYISALNFRNYPIEYKLMGFSPEPWTNLKTALLLKYMADDLTGYTEDIAMTYLRTIYAGKEAGYKLNEIPGITPVIPAGTPFERPSMSVPVPPADSNIHVPLTAADFSTEPDQEGKGSNNWVLSGKRTKSGAAILCDDPHLGLNLPSLWFEVQLQTPSMNVYGVSLPGAPGVVIGFNDNISWGFTNNYRDVKDFYAIHPSADKQTYLFNGEQVPFTKRVEAIGIKGKKDYLDTVLYTVHGPVIYEENFHGPGGLKKPLAMAWMAHRPTNELLSLYLLNRSKGYEDFKMALKHFQCPAQNFAYADKEGNIALWGQGQFINKWADQGVYVMNGIDSSTLWKELIPMEENPHAFNPDQGYLSSANQTVTDNTYPYWYNGYFYQYRAWRINEVLDKTASATVQDMFALQNDVYSTLAARVLPVLIKYIARGNLSEAGKKHLDALRSWNYTLTVNDKTATLFQLLWNNVCNLFYAKDRPYSVPNAVLTKSELVMTKILAQDSSSFKNQTPSWETMPQGIQQAFTQTVDSFDKIGTNTEWYKVKNTSVKHLTKIPAFGYDNLEIGGWGNTVNAAKGDHGPSWRMVVEMTKEINAYGVYPGGQSGNPGSKYYANFLDNWIKGKYYKLSFLPNLAKQNDPSIKHTIIVQAK